MNGLSARRAGFSVVELLIAMLILSVAIISMASVMSQTTRVQGLGLSRAELTAVAESKFEEFRTLAALGRTQTDPPAPFGYLTVGGSVTASDPGYSTQVTSASGRVYRLRWLVEPGPEGSIQVTLRALPQSPSRHELAYLEFKTIIFIGE